jgi:hypothetical protein
MKPRLSTLHGVVSEHHFVKKAVGQLLELAVALLRQAHASHHEYQNRSRHHGVDYTDGVQASQIRFLRMGAE